MNPLFSMRENKPLHQFDQIARTVRKVFLPRFGEARTDELIRQTRKEFEAIIPLLPDIGAKKVFSDFLLFTGMYLAMYRVLKKEGMQVEEMGNLIWEIGVTYVRSVPKFIPRLMGGMNFSKRYLEKLEQRAAESRQRKYAGDYVYDFIPGDGVNFDYGVDYVECASHKFLQAQRAGELTRFICPMDILYSQTLGWGLKRTTTLAEGGQRCDFRFQQGGKTQVAVPRSLQLYWEKEKHNRLFEM